MTISRFEKCAYWVAVGIAFRVIRFFVGSTVCNVYVCPDMQQKNQMLGSRVSKLETEREKLRNECERLDRQCEEMNATLSSPGQISRLWKWSLAQQWQQVSHLGVGGVFSNRIRQVRGMGCVGRK